MAFGMGMAVTFVMSVAALLSWGFTEFILRPGAPLSTAVWHAINPESKTIVDLSMLKYIVYIFVIASSVQFTEMYVRKFQPKLYESFGIFLPLITTNCAVFGACVINIDKEYSFLQALVASFSYAAGFGLALILFAGLRERILLARVPRPLQDTSIALITAGVISLSFYAFRGMV